MLDFAATADVTDAEIIGWIAKDSRCSRSVHQPGKVAGFPRIAAQQPMLSKLPQIAAAADHLARRWRQHIFRRRRGGGHIGNEQVDFGNFESCQRVRPLLAVCPKTCW
jgi:hypothetical protein